MNPIMIEYFRQKLLVWRNDLLGGSQTLLKTLQKEKIVCADSLERASLESDNHLTLRTSERELKLINKINQALERIVKGEYGYCQETGNPISIQRLEARPIATLCIEAQERHELNEKTHYDQT
ncbi:MAG: RNA polymerase-binding protein DksA [Pseudomonadota bacterium]